jgi:M6 family metalloprotease-like protein
MLIAANLSLNVNAYAVHSTTVSTPFLTPSLPLPPIGYAPPQFGSGWPHPVSGVIRVLVIAAAFSDINATLPIAQVKQNWFGAVAPYYHELSYGALTVQGDIYGWYKLPYPESSYGLNCMNINDADCSGTDQSFHLAQDAAALAQNDVDFSKYDYFIFIHSGYGQESSRGKTDIWSVTYMSGFYISIKNQTVDLFSVVPEMETHGASPGGVYCLEFGHDLGLPDLYNTLDGQSILQRWELMDKGAWNGNPPGSSPAHMTAWGKIQLGYISGPKLATAKDGTTSTYTVDPTEIASNNIHAIKIPLSPSYKYYLVEVRAQIGFDTHLPASGVLITSVNDNLDVGKVQVVDGHPSVSDLEDAVWTVGQTFTDSANSLAVTVTSKNGNSYQVTVNRGGGPPPPPQNQNQTTTFIQLAITGINVQPPVVINPNTTVTISIQISNVGTMSATNIPVQVTLDGQVFTNVQVSNVDAGSSTQISFTWVSTVGSHVFQVTLDPGHTINEPSRANHVVSFTVNVGPSLSINIPANITSSGNIWVLINGVRYNFTSTQLIASVSTGLVTVQIESLINVSMGVRQVFTGWSDGSSSNPRQLVVTSSTTIQALYATHYLLSINQNGGSTTPGGWYAANSVTKVSANTTSAIIPNWSRLIFTSWSGDYNSSTPSLSITMTKPFKIQANWVKQYYVTVLSSTGSPSGAGWYNSGTIANVTVQPIVEFSNGTRDVFIGWNSTSFASTLHFPVNSPTRLQAVWKLQYLLQVASSYGAPEGSGWYDVGSVAKISVQPQVNYNNQTRRIFVGWRGDYSGKSANFTLPANKPMSIAAEWITQYQVTFKVAGLPNSTYVTVNVNNQNIRIAPNQPYSTWYNQGQTLNPTTNQTVMTFFQFDNWHNSTGFNVAKPIIVNSPAEYTASYQPVLGIPGFPVESVLIGIATGLLTIKVARERRRGKKTSQLTA